MDIIHASLVFQEHIYSLFLFRVENKLNWIGTNQSDCRPLCIHRCRSRFTNVLSITRTGARKVI